MKTNILGLDLSIRSTGIAYPDGVLDTIKPTLEGDRRLIELSMAVRSAVLHTHPNLAMVEDLPNHSKGAVRVLGMVHGVVRYTLMIEGCSYMLVPVATLKTYATGKGTATKADMRLELFRRTGVDVDDEDECDAAWLRLLGLDFSGEPELALPQTHRRALAKLGPVNTR
jgi:Holliday junction resolvasome RuvABC endonuclease subunit